MFGNFFKKKQVEVQKIQNRDEMEAVCAGGIYIAFADGDCEPHELESLKGILRDDPSMAAFGSELDATIDKFVQMMTKSPTRGKLQVMRELQDCNCDDRAKENIAAILVDITNVDGQLDDVEITALKECGRALNVSMTQFGIE